ncbi:MULTISPECIES: hypothetical protein [unclassified Streptomyces]|uniref:hypothetical protein n=1 Tax=unclassified Streptomyces TaxID=2593676 RepID=UPI0033B619B6
MPHAVDHPGRDVALTPAQRAAAVQAHQQAAMPELLEGRTTDPATWMRTPEALSRFAAVTREAEGRRRAVAARNQPDSATAPDSQQQHHTHQPGQDGGEEPGR